MDASASTPTATSWPAEAAAEDNNCCNLPTGPDPARPNNMFAPFWTDLDGTGAQGIFAATLDGRRQHLDRRRVSSQRLRDDQQSPLPGLDRHQRRHEDITFAYDPAALPADPAGQDFLVGAENVSRSGRRDELPADRGPGGHLQRPHAGRHDAYGVTIRFNKKGTYDVTTEMEASGVPGTTIVRTPVLVQKP